MTAHMGQWAGHQCHYCDQPATTLDHIVPKSWGGKNGKYNLVPACQPCNLAKDDQWPTCPCGRCEIARYAYNTPHDSRDQWSQVERLKRQSAAVFG